LNMKREPEFERYTYQQQANSVKMVVNWVVPAVSAHMRKGRLERTDSVSEYPDKVIRQLELVIGKLRQLR
jgi:hypothetical protein